MESSSHEDAIQSFECALAQMQHYGGRPLLVISLVSFCRPAGNMLRSIGDRLSQVSGWKFDDLGITIRQRLCEVLVAAGREKAASEVVLETVNTFGVSPIA